MPKTTYSLYTLYDPTKPLPSVYEKRAVKELKEVPDQVQAHLESFRRWLTSMPHLKCVSDDAFLLAFLRHAKYNHMKAQHRLDNLCTFRTSSTEGCPAWFEETQSRKTVWNKWVDMKCYAPLGFTREGTLVAMTKCSSLDFSEFSVSQIQNAFQIWDDLCLVDPRMQIGGTCWIIDFTQYRKEDIIKMFEPKFMRFGTKYYQDCLPFRIKGMIFYNVPKIVENLFKLYSEWFTEKIKSRIMLLGADMSRAFETFPGLKELMPESYGGENKLSFEEICDQQASLMKSLPDVARPFTIAVDESKRPKDCRNMFRVYKDLTADVMGKSGTYVKLNQDAI